MKVKVINKSRHQLPQYETLLSAGMDVRANLDEPIVLKPLARALIPTGLFVELPAGYEMQVRPRSGLAAKYGLTVLNAPGTIDAGYRGEVGVILFNFGKEDFIIKRGDRIAQMVFARLPETELVPVTELSATDRGEGGFGSTGKK